MTERLETIKDEADVPTTFKGVVSLQVVDGKVEAVTIYKDGETLRIVASDSYSHTLKVLVPETKEEKKIFTVSGTLSGVEIIPKGFDDEYEAKSFMQQHDYKDETELFLKTQSVFVDKTKL